MPAIRGQVYAPERPSLIQTGNRAAQGADCRTYRDGSDAREAAILRGHADLIALRLACHRMARCTAAVDLPAGCWSRARPSTPSSKRASRRLGPARRQGVAGNLDAMLDDRFKRVHYAYVCDAGRCANRGCAGDDRARKADRHEAAWVTPSWYRRSSRAALRRRSRAGAYFSTCLAAAPSMISAPSRIRCINY